MSYLIDTYNIEDKTQKSRKFYIFPLGIAQATFQDDFAIFCFSVRASFVISILL